MENNERTMMIMMKNCVFMAKSALMYAIVSNTAKTIISIRKASCVGKILNQPSLKPKMYMVTANPWETYLGIPRLPPTSNPRACEMIA